MKVIEKVLSKDNLNGALNNDQVIVEITSKKGLKLEGRIVKIVERKTQQYVGTVYYKNNKCHIDLDDKKVNIDIIIDKGEFDFDKFVWRIAATTACRMSVMANTYISKEDEEWILENIRYCDNPFTCPHGRPTIITYSRYELERLFKRQLD